MSGYKLVRELRNKNESVRHPTLKYSNSTGFRIEEESVKKDQVKKIIKDGNFTHDKLKHSMQGVQYCQLGKSDLSNPYTQY